MDSKKSTLKKVLRIIAITSISIFVILFVIGTVHTDRVEKTKKAVAKIHSTKLTLDDVMGKSLPPDPGSEADKTIQGIDANKNNIRDDVELAIFKEYPNSAKTRAVLLQYALALQMEMTQDLVNEETVIAVAEQTSRGYLCIGKILSRNNMEKYTSESTKLREFIEMKQINNLERENIQNGFYSNLTSGTIPSDNLCDIEFKFLLN